MVMHSEWKSMAELWFCSCSRCKPKELTNFFIQSENAARWRLSYKALRTLFPPIYNSKEERMQEFFYYIGQEVYQGYPLKDDKVTIVSQQYIDSVRMYIVSQDKFLTKPLLIKKENDLAPFAEKPPATHAQMEARLIKAGNYTVEPYGQQEAGRQSRLFKVTKEEFARADSRHGVDPGPTWYIVSEDMCSCDDFKYRSGLTGGMCKHRMACCVAGVLRL